MPCQVFSETQQKRKWRVEMAIATKATQHGVLENLVLLVGISWIKILELYFLFSRKEGLEQAKIRRWGICVGVWGGEDGAKSQTKKVSLEKNVVGSTTWSAVSVRALQTCNERKFSEDEIRRLQEVMDDAVIFSKKRQQSERESGDFH